LLNDYLGSDLCRFHRMFYSVPQDDPSQWAGGYDRTPLGALPPCAVHVLTEPNDWLLKPSGIQLVTRCLLACGWHPRHIAGLDPLEVRDPFTIGASAGANTTRPSARSFMSASSPGKSPADIDEGVDFNCVSQQEKQFCWNPCGCSLEPPARNLFHPLQPQPTPTMSDWRCGISTGCFYKTDILQALPQVRDGGFTTIEVCSFPAHLDYHNRNTSIRRPS
jgi:hypothetical protein